MYIIHHVWVDRLTKKAKKATTKTNTKKNPPLLLAAVSYLVYRSPNANNKDDNQNGCT